MVYMKKSMTKILFNCEDGEVSLPLSAVDSIDRARKFDIKVLFLISGYGKNANEECFPAVAKALECDVSDVKASVAFWNGTGVISLCDGEEEPISSKKKAIKTEEPKKKIKSNELPQYTTDELNALLEKHRGVGSFIDECQNVLGKMFNTSDVKTIMGMIDYLGLNEEYILVLMHHFSEKEVKSMRYIEKTAISCLDEGIVDAHVLEETLLARDAAKEAQGRIKAIFGLNSRSLTAKEKMLVEAWLGTYKFDMDIITKAYEITVDAISKPSLPYAGKILEKWYTEGLKTVSEVDEYLSSYKKEQGENTSFDLDEFFDAAVKRSYGDEN